MPFKVIEGHRFWYQEKTHLRLLLGLWLILSYIVFRTISKLLQFADVQIWYEKRHFAFIETTLRDWATYAVRRRLMENILVDLYVMAEVLRENIDWKSLLLEGIGHFGRKF